MPRKVDTTIEIHAPAEAVWKALTNPEELTRWFCLNARVQPGQGGSIYYSWGPPYEGENRIEAWEPGRRLRLVTDPPGGDKPGWLVQSDEPPAPGAVPLVLEYLLESSSGVTTLRLVHSGFGDTASWDDEYDGVRRGWAFELRSLRHYLERHRGRSRAYVMSRRPIAGSMTETWERAMGPQGLVRGGMPAGVSPGRRVSLDLATGDRLEGTLLLLEAPAVIAMTVENLGDALFRFELFRAAGQLEGSLWLAAWDRATPELAPLQARWDELMVQLFAGR